MRTGNALRSCVVLLALCALAHGCRGNAEWSGPAPSPDFAQFQQNVYPLLLRDCAFSECHGSEQRFFQVYGPGRTRLEHASMPSDPATPMEVQRSYERAVSMLMSGKTVLDSLLLRKPLETSEGGQGHKGIDAFGRNVFTSARDPGYVVLLQWAMSNGAGPAAAPAMGAKP